MKCSKIDEISNSKVRKVCRTLGPNLPNLMIVLKNQTLNLPNPPKWPNLEPGSFQVYYKVKNIFWLISAKCSKSTNFVDFVDFVYFVALWSTLLILHYRAANLPKLFFNFWSFWAVPLILMFAECNHQYER